MNFVNKLACMSALLLCVVSTSVNAMPILSFNQQNADYLETIGIGESTIVDLWISGIGAGDDLAGFDISLAVNSFATSFDSVSYAVLPEFDILNPVSVSPLISLSGLSFSADLSAQADSFQIATLSFTGMQVGTTMLSISSALLSDALAFDVNFAAFSATINVLDTTQVPPQVNAPTLLFTMLVLTLVMLCKRRFNYLR